MELPEPNSSDELIAELAEIEANETEWLVIGEKLRQRASDANDLQAGWLMTAFDYSLARRVGDYAKNAPPFGANFVTDQFAYPLPLGQVPAEVVALWSDVAERSTGDASQARLHHLLFELRQGNRGHHARAAAAAYLAIGTGTGERIQRVNCLHWSLDLSRRIKDNPGAELVHSPLVALASDSLAQVDSPEPGVALHSIEVLASDVPRHPQLADLLDRARVAYPDARLTGETIRIQRSLVRGEDSRLTKLNREHVLTYLAQADQLTGLMRMVNLEDAAQLATTYGLADLLKTATVGMQAMSFEELGLKETSYTVTFTAGVLEAQVRRYTQQSTLGDALSLLIGDAPPTGDIETTRAVAAHASKSAPLIDMFTVKHIGADALSRYTATTNEERVDEKLARAEMVHMTLAMDGFARILDSLMSNFTPTEDELIEVIGSADHVAVATATTIAKALMAFHASNYEEAVTLTMPRIETLARARLVELGELQFRVQQGHDRGQYPQLGSMLRALQPHLDESWSRFLRTFLVSQFGSNFRNELAHGFVDVVGGHQAALTIVAALHLALTPVRPDARS
ncbi:DUF4209 domain-containing protein [Cryobacterium algoricola]|uniref:DUF4209 domain-containing protein n=1 Tax=Cryobacterium algoricola TaxID=1259183 RepID=A0ABY2IH81_9MICO|nr:DUF4209 domain-containing protein [Cryobacterium algoricola]TFB88245.1 DUF4209 domain-containing protein [Cryobacterium algoricola]